MSPTTLCISFRFIQPDPLFHGRGDGDEPEWPPSPLRAFQALVNAACLRMRNRQLTPEVRSILQSIETLRPTIVAPVAAVSATGYRAFVPHNQNDLVLAALARGADPSTEAFRKLSGSVRIEKDFRPYRIRTGGEDLPTVQYIYLLSDAADPVAVLETIRPVVRSVHCLGWGIDQVVADVSLVDSISQQLPGELWAPTPRGGRRLRVHRKGSLDALMARHRSFLSRLRDNSWTPVPPLVTLEQVRYRRPSDPLSRPHALFKLVDNDDDTVTYPQSRLVHVAGMVKHLAIQAMQKNPPTDLRGLSGDEWVRSYVGGHQSRQSKDNSTTHTQFSYVPLQSLGHPNTDPGVRRVMIIAPIGDEDWLEHLARHLDGALLRPLPNTELPPDTRLERIDDDKSDGVRDRYTRPSNTWASATPVILPGHDDRKPDKTRSLIVKALGQSHVEQPCTFKWSAFSRFRQMLPAHKYRKDPADPSKPITVNYVRPNHLLDQTAVHLTLTFANGIEVPGPLTLGAGRHCGFGVMAATNEAGE